MENDNTAFLGRRGLFLGLGKLAFRMNILTFNNKN